MFLSLVSFRRILSLRVFTKFAAANYGTGSRGGGVSTLICAVIDDRHPDGLDEEPKSVISFTIVFCPYVVV